MKTFILACLFILASVAPAFALEKSSVTIGGEVRDFYVHIPPNISDDKLLPAVIMLHGGGGNAANAEQQTNFDAVADKYGFMAVYPEGNGAMIKKSIRTWNAGLCCGGAVRSNADDVGFISAIIDALVRDFGADKKRIYATGHSNGAMMSYRLACELSDKIAAIAPNSGQRVFADCHPKRHVPVLHIHGTADPCALYNGGQQCGGCFTKALGLGLPMSGDQWACRPVPDVVAEHAQMNGCSMETDVVMKTGAVTCRAFRCPADGATVLCSIAGAGHSWPGTSDSGPTICAAKPDRPICKKFSGTTGNRNSDIDASDVIWNFFKNQHLP